MHTRSKGIIISYLKIAVNMVCGLVLSSALLRMLGDTEYGIYQTIAAFANYLALLEFGVGTVMIRNISMCRGRNAPQEEIQRNISTTWTLTCLLALLVLAVSMLFYILIPGIYQRTMSSEQIRHAQNIFVFITGYLFFNFLIHTVNAVIFSFENYSYGAVQSILRTSLRMILLVTLLIWYKNAVVIALVDLGLAAFCFVCSWLYCRKKLNVKLRFGKCDPVILRASLPLAVAVFLQGIVSQANNNVDKFLIGMLLSPESVSLYSVALYIYSVFSSLVNIPSYMYIPTVTQAVGQGLMGEKLMPQLVLPCRLTALTGGLVLFGFAAVGRQFVGIVYGQEYLLAWPLAVILISPAYLDTVVGVLVNVLDAMNKRMARSAVLIFTTVLNIVLTVFCLNRWGVMGATVATAVCTMIGPVIIMSVYYQKVVRIPMLRLFGQTFKGILVYLVLGCGAALGIGYLLGDGWLSFLVSGIAFVALALGGYYFLGMTDKEKQTVTKLLRKQ